VISASSLGLGKRIDGEIDGPRESPPRMVRASSATDAFSDARPWRQRVLVRAWGSGVLSRRIGTIGFPRLAAAIHSPWTHGDRAARFDHRSTSAQLA